MTSMFKLIFQGGPIGIIFGQIGSAMIQDNRFFIFIILSEKSQIIENATFIHVKMKVAQSRARVKNFIIVSYWKNDPKTV